MKKNLFIGAILVFALIVTGCPKSADEPVQPKKEEVSVSDVKDSEADNSVKELTDDGKTGKEIAALFSTAIEEQLTAEGSEIQKSLEEIIEPIIKKFQNPVDTENLNNRSVTVDDLTSKFAELMQKIEDFNKELAENGKASLKFSATPGEISDLDESGVFSIDISKLNISTNEVTLSVSEDEESEYIVNGKSNVEAAATGKFDFTKVDELKDFVIRGGVLKVALNGDYASANNSGSLNANLTASSVITVIIPEGDKKYGGKILSKASLKFDCSKIEELGEATVENIGKYLTIDITSDLYTDDGDKVCELLKITTLDELVNLIPDIPSEEE